MNTVIYNRNNSFSAKDALRLSEIKTAPGAVKRGNSKGVVVLSQPTDMTAKIGSYVNFAAVVRCNNPTFQWFDKFGSPIPRRNTTNISFGPVKEEDFGFYCLQITDEISKQVALTRWVELKKMQPKSASIPESKNNMKTESNEGEKGPLLLRSPEGGEYRQGDMIQLTGYFDNATDYQWYKDGEKLEGCTWDTLSISNAYEANTGKYTLAALNGNKVIISEPAKITIN